MRITSTGYSASYIHTLNNIQESKYKSETKITTGGETLSLADSPKNVVNEKLLNENISRNKKYISNIEAANTTMQASSNAIEGMIDMLYDARTMAINSTQTSNMGNLNTLAGEMRNQIDDFILKANTEANGAFLFAGTATNNDSLTEADGTTHDQPFALVEGEPTADNPSGLTVEFYGNLKDKSINKDAATSEVINVTADDMFGADGVEALSALIDLYNVMAYNEDGTLRDDLDYYTTTDTAKLSDAQAKIADLSDNLSRVNSVTGSKMNRINAIKEQMTTENTRLNSVLTSVADTNYADATMQLSKDKAALEYALQVGSLIQSQNTLFDFLS